MVSLSYTEENGGIWRIAHIPEAENGVQGRMLIVGNSVLARLQEERPHQDLNLPQAIQSR